MMPLQQHEMERPLGLPGAEEAGPSTSAAESAAAGLVAKHYSMRQDHGPSQRQESFIIGLRQLNNWVKVSAAPRAGRSRRRRDVDPLLLPQMSSAAPFALRAP